MPVYRMYLSYGYPNVTLHGPYKVTYHYDNSESYYCLEKEQIIELKRMYLNRLLIPSSTYITIQALPDCDDSALCSLPFNYHNASTMLTYNNVLMPAFEMEDINFSDMFKSARHDQLLKEPVDLWQPWEYHLFYSTVLVLIFSAVSHFVFFATFTSEMSSAPISEQISNRLTCILNYTAFSCTCVWLMNTYQNIGCCKYICCKCIPILYILIASTMFFGPAVCIYGCVGTFIISKPLDKLIGNSDSNQMEMDIAYFILSKLKKDNCELILNLSYRILNIGIIDIILGDLERTGNNMEETLKFQDLLKHYVHCLFHSDLSHQIVEKIVDFDQDIQRKMSLYLVIRFILINLNYVVVFSLYAYVRYPHHTFSEWELLSFVCDIILIVLFFCLEVEIYKYYQHIIQSSVHWLDPVSFRYLCDNDDDKTYGMQFLSQTIFHYCYLIDIYMNNYLIYETLHSCYELNNNNLIYSLPNDAFNVLISYLWFHPDYDKINENRRFQIYDAPKLKSMVCDKQNELLLGLNELIMITKQKEEEYVDIDVNYLQKQNKITKSNGSNTKYTLLSTVEIY